MAHAPPQSAKLMGISKLDDSCISNPEIRNLKLDSRPDWLAKSNLQFRNFGFEIQASSPVIIISAYKTLKETYVA
jgi:hypothetical protein